MGVLFVWRHHQKKNVAPQAKGVVETGSHIRPKSVGELAHQRRGRDIFAKAKFRRVRMLERKGHQRVSFSFGDIIIKPNVAPQAKGVAETGSHSPLGGRGAGSPDGE